MSGPGPGMKQSHFRSAGVSRTGRGGTRPSFSSCRAAERSRLLPHRLGPHKSLRSKTAELRQLHPFPSECLPPDPRPPPHGQSCQLQAQG